MYCYTRNRFLDRAAMDGMYQMAVFFIIIERLTTEMLLQKETGCNLEREMRRDRLRNF